MANRSDFLGHFPRQIKRMIIMGKAQGHIKDDAHAGDVRSLFIAAHRSHKAFKTQRKLPVETTAGDSDSE